MQRRSLSTLLGAVLCVGLLTACSDTTSPFGRQAAATYSLQTVNGYRLPYSFGNQDGSTTFIQGDAYVLHDDNSYGEITNETVSDGYQSYNVTETEIGTWSQNGNTIVFRPTSSTRGSFSSYSGYLDGQGTLRISLNGTVSIYYAQ
jgi:hypothetical protein